VLSPIAPKNYPNKIILNVFKNYFLNIVADSACAVPNSYFLNGHCQVQWGLNRGKHKSKMELDR
jgi:hypothetical protein